MSNQKEFDKCLNIINDCLDALYREDNFSIDLCERCLVFRFAHHLQNILNTEYPNVGYFVDCDYNSSCYFDAYENKWIKRNGKPIINQKTGEIKKRFIDIIVHKREKNDESDFICFEIKKWNNKKGIEKDKNNLKVLTSQYGYKFGFWIVLKKDRKNIKIKSFEEGYKIKK